MQDTDAFNSSDKMCGKQGPVVLIISTYILIDIEARQAQKLVSSMFAPIIKVAENSTTRKQRNANELVSPGSLLPKAVDHGGFKALNLFLNKTYL